MSIRDATFINALEGATLQRGKATDGIGSDEEGFSNALLDAIQSSEPPRGVSNAPNLASAFISRVDQAQQVADDQVERLANGEGNVHETAIALEKADIQMRLLMRSRDKVVQAYQEIMRMAV